MKKVFLLLTLIAATIGAWGATTVTKTVSQLKTMHGWEKDKCYYQPFALDDVITISSVDGTSKYLDETTPKMRYYHWNEKGYGSIIIKAKAGYVITSVKLKYGQSTARSVACLFWYNNNQNVPVCDTLGNNVAHSFYSNQVVLFSGNMTATNGQIRVTEYSVTYEQATLGRMYTKSTMDLGMQYGWSHSSHPKDITLNDKLSLHSDANTLKYYCSTTDRCFACYQANGKFWFNAHNGATIKKIRVYYFTQSNQGVLCLSSDFGTDGKSIPSAKQIASGQTVTVNGTSVSFNCGSKTTSIGGQIRITGFQIEYTDGNSQMETYTNLTAINGSSEVKYTGDNGYKWKVKNFAHRDTCAMYDYLGTRLFYNGYIATDGTIEGGIKNAMFEWRLANAANGGTVISEPTKFTVQAGSVSDVCTQTETTRSAGHHMTYNHDFEVKSNCAFSINVGAKESTAQAQPIFGPVTITPYLLYTKKSVTINAKDYASQNFKYTNSALINNTEGAGTISYAVSGENADKIASINSSTGEVSILGEGIVTVTASWEGVTTTYQLTIQLETPSVGFAEQLVTKMVSAGSYKQPLTLTTPSSGTVTYSMVSAPTSYTLDADGTVHFTEAGDYVVKGMFADLPYKPASDTYTLRVTDLLVPELSFASDNIEKPVGAAAFINPFHKPNDDEGAVTYKSDSTHVATVEENADGTVTIVGAGTTTITASVAETDKYAAGNKSYTLKVFPLSDISIAGDTNVYLNAPAFTRVVKVNAGDGAISYKSSNTNIATVDDNGLVTLTGTAFGLDTITAIIAKTDNYWADTATYTVNVSSLKLPAASFAVGTVNKVQGFEAFTKEASTESDGVKHYFSSDTRVATVNETTGEVTKGEKPGTTIISVSLDASDTWAALDNAAQYTLNVSAAPIADLHVLTSTITALKNKLGWPDAPAAGQEYTNFAINDVLTMSYGKHLYEDVYGTGKIDLLRYYYQDNTNASKLTIQAKAGVIIQSVKLTYKAGANSVFTDEYCYGKSASEGHKVESGVPFKVDANAVTFYNSVRNKSDVGGGINVTSYEITYFDPETGVAVTKTTLDLATQNSWTNEQVIPEVKINQAISLKSTKNLKYYTSSHCLHSYGMSGAVDLVARPGAKIHYVKFTYTVNGNGILTKYFGTDGKNIPVEDRIASDSIIYVNADSLRFYVGTTSDNYQGTMYLSKIYVNYTDNSEVTVDNFDNCNSPGTGGSEPVAGVDGKYNWSIYNFSRSDANRMYYDQSIKLNKDGKIVTEYTGGLKEVAFDWHPTTDAAVNFTVKAGEESFTVDSAAKGGVYTFNFKKQNIKSNGEFSIKVNGTTPVEIGHISLTPYLIYTCKDTTIAAKTYKDAGYKFTNPSLINYTAEKVSYSITGDAMIAEVNDSTGEVTINGGGTVKVNATADGVTASYQLTINLETTSASFAEHTVEQLLSAGSYKQELQVETEATEGNEITYSFIGDHEGASIDTSTGLVTFSQAGQFKILGQLAQNMPYAAAHDSFTLTVTGKDVPHISYEVKAVSRRIDEGVYTNTLTSLPGVGDTTYVSTNMAVATVDSTGEVTPLKVGKTTIKAYVAESENYAADSAQYTFTVLGEPVPGIKSVVGNIAEIAERDSWSDGQHRPYFKLDDVISVSDSNKNNLNSHYLKSEECVRFYQNQTKGQFFIRAKAGAIIQAVQFTYTSQNDGVITNDYGSDGKSIAENKRCLSGVTYKFDANKLIFYTGSTADKNNGEVHITSIVVRYFDPEKGEAVTKNVIDLGKQYGLVNEKAYQDVVVNNVISLHADQANSTLKYFTSGNLNCYRWTGPIYVKAREGVLIHNVKISYSAYNSETGGIGTLTQNFGTDGMNIPEEDCIASDSVLAVNANEVKLWIGNTNGIDATLGITKIYVNYTDSNAIVDNFDNCTKIYGGSTPIEVMGVDSTFEWEFTQFNRDSLRRIGYDQSTMLRQAGGKIAANNVDGGIKEVSFDWFASNSNQGAKFYVKAGETTDTVQLAATGGWYPRTYTLTDIKTNGAFSIEMDPASGSQMEVGHISLTPYLFYKEKEVNVTVNGTYTNNSLVDYRDSNDAITYESSKDSVASVDPATGLVTANHVGTATITASWNGASTSYTINVAGDKTTIVLKRNDNTENADTIVNNYGETIPNPSMTLPTRTGYRFNAYFPDAAASKESERITVTSWDEKTYWVQNVFHNGVQMTDANRYWIYDRPTYTLYAQWMPELTIVLDNQGATTAGTEQVKTAHCPNNASVNLSQNITVPVKDGYTFLGYFTADSVKLIDANGAFIAKVSGYTNETRMWQKDEGATLYAHWNMVAITLDEALNNDSVINSHIGKVVGQVDLVRTLAAGKYNTFCLPFDITKADLATALKTEIVSLATLDENSEARLTESKLYILATELEDDSVMHAGKPYLLQIAEEVKDPSFSFVTIGKANDSIVSSDGSVKFYGITSPFTVPVDNQYLFMSNNMLNWNNTGVATDMKGLRAYFHVEGLTNPSQVSARLVFRLPQTPTGMENVNDNDNTRKMIIDNQLIIIRDGKMFNAQGQFVK